LDGWSSRRTILYGSSLVIKWINKAHKRLDGFKTYTALPDDKTFTLFHPKTIERQEKQNNYYNIL
jgi:hypothetical protein